MRFTCALLEVVQGRALMLQGSELPKSLQEQLDALGDADWVALAQVVGGDISRPAAAKADRIAMLDKLIDDEKLLFSVINQTFEFAITDPDARDLRDFVLRQPLVMAAFVSRLPAEFHDRVHRIFRAPWPLSPAAVDAIFISLAIDGRWDVLGSLFARGDMPTNEAMQELAAHVSGQKDTLARAGAMLETARTQRQLEQARPRRGNALEAAGQTPGAGL